MRRIHGMNALLLLGLAMMGMGESMAAPLRFEVTVGDERNWFVQDARGAFHLSTTEKPEPRLVLASPAGNTGVALWFAEGLPIVTVSPTLIASEKVQLELRIDRPLTLNRAVLGSIRTIRDLVHGAARALPFREALERRLGAEHAICRRIGRWEGLDWQLGPEGDVAELDLESLDGVHRYLLSLKGTRGSFSLSTEPSGPALPRALHVRPGTLRLIYESNHRPLTPFTEKELLTKPFRERLSALTGPRRQRLDRLLRGLRFLCYHEKFLAGSWRYLTYFGRDSLISMRLLAPALSLEVLEGGLGSVAERMSADGEVCHEEALACQGAIDSLRAWLDSGAELPPPDLARPAHDRKMIDDDFLVLPLLDDCRRLGGRRLFDLSEDRHRPFLRNANRVLALVASGRSLSLPEGQHVGDWRDSNEGLGWGREPFSVNAAHVPAALLALKSLLAGQAWGGRALVDACRQEGLSRLGWAVRHPRWLDALVDCWSGKWKAFHVRLAADLRRRRLDAQRRRLGLPLSTGPLPYEGGFLALARTASHQPLPILHGDLAFMLLDLPLAAPEPFGLAMEAFETPFPDGLASPAGYLTALPALAATEEQRELFDRNHYHGSVIWDWPQVLLQVALMKRLGRWPLPSPRGQGPVDSERRRLERLLRQVEDSRDALRAWSGSELWTWRLDGSRPVPSRFGGSEGAASESNALQLWSVAGLAVDTLHAPLHGGP